MPAPTSPSAECRAVLGGGAAATGRRWPCVHRAGDRRLDWTKPRRWTSMGLQCGQTALAEIRRGDAGQVAGRRRSAAMAAKVVVPPAGRIAEARRPVPATPEQREAHLRTSMRWSRRIQNGRTRPGADGGCRSVAVPPAWQRGTLARRAAGQLLIAIRIVSNRGVLLRRWWWRRAERPPALGQLRLAGASGEGVIVADAVEAGREHVNSMRRLNSAAANVMVLWREAPLLR